MEEETLQLVSKQLPDIRPQQIKAALGLMDEGNTIPFIARYRKEMTGTLDGGCQFALVFLGSASIALRQFKRRPLFAI